MLVSKAKFLSYQSMFYRRIQQTPYKIGLEVVTVKEREPSDDFSFEDFVGDNPRESKTYTLRALYEKEVPSRTREKYGLADKVNGVVYLSPKQLAPLLGDYHLNKNRTKIHFERKVQVIDKIIYLEDFIEYGSCVGIQIFIKDDLTGG